MTEPIKVDEALLNRLFEASRAHHIALISDPYNRFGDDWGDYTNASLEIFTAMFNMRWDQTDLEALDLMLNTPPPAEDDPKENWGDIDYKLYPLPRLSNLGCDGIPPEFYELNCPALPKED